MVGHTYGFYSVAVDNVGDVQPTPAAAQATTTGWRRRCPSSPSPSRRVTTPTSAQGSTFEYASDVTGNDEPTSARSAPTGRYIVFASDAANLVPDDANGDRDVFIEDTRTGQVTLVSVDAAGTSSGDGGSDSPVISATAITTSPSSAPPTTSSPASSPIRAASRSGTSTSATC